MKSKKQRNDTTMKNDSMNEEVPMMASSAVADVDESVEESTAADYDGQDDSEDVAAPVDTAPASPLPDPLALDAEVEPNMVHEFDVDDLVADPARNGRFKERLITDSSVKELAEAIKLEGQLEPGKVMLGLDGKRYVAFGTGRYLAIKLINSTRAKKDRLPFLAFAFLETSDDPARQRVQNAMENLHRKDLGPLDKMKIAVDLIEKEGLNQKQVAARLAVKPAMITMYVRLSKLPPDVIQLIADEKISATAVYDLTVVMNDPKVLEKEVKRLVDGAKDGKRVTVGTANAARGKVKAAKGEKGEGKAGRKGSKQRPAKQILSFIEAEATTATNQKYGDKSLDKKLMCFAAFVRGQGEGTFLKNLAAL